MVVRRGLIRVPYLNLLGLVLFLSLSGCGGGSSYSAPPPPPPPPPPSLSIKESGVVQGVLGTPFSLTLHANNAIGKIIWSLGAVDKSEGVVKAQNSSAVFFLSPQRPQRRRRTEALNLSR